MTNETTPVDAPEPTSYPVVVVGAGGYVGSRLAAGLARTGRTVLAASRRPLPASLFSASASGVAGHGDPVPDGGPGPGRSRTDASPGPGPVPPAAPGGGLVRPVTYSDLTGLGDAVRSACDRDGLPLPGGVAASIGGWHLGARLLDEPDLDGWRATLDSHLTAHLAAARALVPLLRDSAGPHPAYVVLNGAARTDPMAGSGAINVTGAGLAMLIRVLNLEEDAPGVTRPGEVPGPGVDADGPGGDPASSRGLGDDAPGPGDAAAGAGGGPGPADAGASRRVRFHELVIDHAVAGDDRNVTPDRTVPPAAVAAAVTTILADPATPAVVHV
ncbi:hypothetical protein [Myceligenerans halotolerans]